MKDMGFCYAEPSPDPFGGARTFPWWRVMYKHPAAHPTVKLDFVSPEIANATARTCNLEGSNG